MYCVIFQVAHGSSASSDQRERQQRQRPPEDPHHDVSGASGTTGKTDDIEDFRKVFIFHNREGKSKKCSKGEKNFLNGNRKILKFHFIPGNIT